MYRLQSVLDTILRYISVIAYLLCSVLGVNGLDFLSHKIHVVFQFLDLAVHLVNQAVAFLAAGVEETEIVLVCLNLIFDCLILAHESCSFVVKCVLALLCHVLYFVFEVGQASAGTADIKLFVQLVYHSVELIVQFVFLLIWYMTYRIVFLDKFLHRFLGAFRPFFGQGFESLDDSALFVKIVVFLFMLAGCGGIARFEEILPIADR